MSSYLLDTSLVSELARPRPAERIVAAFAKHFEDVRLASLVVHELTYGIARLPAGKRKETLRGAVDVLTQGVPVLPYDAAAADWHAMERARLEMIGRVPSFADGMIAATAAVHGCVLVTLNPRDFRPFTLSVESWT